MVITLTRKLISILGCLLPLLLAGQEHSITRIEPPNWWTGMKSPDLQLLVYGNKTSELTPVIDYPGITIRDYTTLQNLNYLFINLEISHNVAPGTLEIKFMKQGKLIQKVPYELLSRNKEYLQHKGFSSHDIIYLLMPDRFANGNPANDNDPLMKEGLNRNDPNGRHGGDIAGIRNHLDHIKDLGMTAVWFNPLVENNNPAYSYHGYAISDFYRIDPRFGSNQDYLSLVEACHKKGLKVIMDMIFNHCSIDHWFIKDLPSADWIHSFEEYTRSNFRASTITDPYASEFDRNRMLTGWFDRHMPDLNQKNPYLAAYLIQNSIWWVEYAGLDGIRIDTQPYPFKEFMTTWSDKIYSEFPDLGVVGEAWMQQEATTAYFQDGNLNRDGYTSGIPSVTDFPLYFSVTKGLNENEGWTEGMSRIYNTLALDYVYPDASKNLIFLDNHDLTRFTSAIGGDMNKFMTGIAFLFTTRGIPMIYYGTEIMMKGFEHDGHGHIREDFPGGWQDDTLSVFTKQKLSREQQQALEFLQKMAGIRNSNPEFRIGKLVHFVPDDGIYVYFRISNDSRSMVVLNNKKTDSELDIKRFNECTAGHSGALNLLTGETLPDISRIKLTAGKPLLLKLIK